MHFATRVRTWRVARLYSAQCTVQWNSSISETVRNRTRVHIYTFLLRMTDTMTSQNIKLSSWDTLYNAHFPLMDTSLGRISFFTYWAVSGICYSNEATTLDGNLKNLILPLSSASHNWPLVSKVLRSGKKKKNQVQDRQLAATWVSPLVGSKFCPYSYEET
jgi:hypothetical protein